jgi:4-hydroxy-2-oxoheptanedioate aldolase
LDYGDSIGQLAAGDINYTTNIVAQLETVQAVERIDEIVKSDFIDMFFIGPGDLSMDMGIFGQFSNPRLTDTILMLRQKTAAAGKRLGVFAGSFDAARNWLDKDFDMVIVNSELAI